MKGLRTEAIYLKHMHDNDHLYDDTLALYSRLLTPVLTHIAVLNVSTVNTMNAAVLQQSIRQASIL